MRLELKSKGTTFTLTTDHAASINGQPVCIESGNVYGRTDVIPGGEFGSAGCKAGLLVGYAADENGLREHPMVLAFCGC